MNVLYEKARPNPSGYRDIDPAEVAPARGTVRVVDVREPAEYTGELGHAPGAELVPLGTVDRAAHGWDREQELVLVCRSGARSGRAAALLATMGFRHVMNMTGGMLAWNAAQLPVER
jgi:rhodanese-related sulfurtransferase